MQDACKARKDKEKQFGENRGSKAFLKRKEAKMQIFQKTGVPGSLGMQVEGLRAILQVQELKCNLGAKQSFYMIFQKVQGPMCNFQIMQGQECNLICKTCSEK